MQTSGQFGVPPPEVPPQYSSVNNAMNNGSNSSNRATSTPGSNQTLGHTLFNLSNQDQQHVSSLSPSPACTTNPHSAHGQKNNAPLVLLGKGLGLRDSAVEELLQEAASRQNHEDHHFSHFLHAAAASMEHFQQADGASMEQYQLSLTSENAAVPHPQQQIVQQKQGNSALGAATPAHAPASTSTPPTSLQAHTLTVAHLHTAEPMPAKHTISDNADLQKRAEAMQLHRQYGLDQSINEAASNMKSRESQLMNADPLSLGDIDQAEEGAGAGNRWPRQETLALLKIRANMDAAFRDTSCVKRPLWDEVSRKLGELGYERSAKKCKEKFENVNKYYKRTKEGKVGRQDGKSYRFFTQLEALSTNTGNTTTHNNNNKINNSITSFASPSSMLISSSNKFQAGSGSAQASLLQGSVLVGTSAADNKPVEAHFFASSAPLNAQPLAQQPSMDMAFHPPHFDANAGTALLSTFQSSSDDDGDDEDDVDDAEGGGDDVIDEDDPEEYHRFKPRPNAPLAPSYVLPPTDSKKRKRKSSASMMAFFESLLNKVIDKQEQMQQKFLQAMERRESDRMIREEAWRRQEMARLSKEHELRAQERSSAAARDAALITFLQKVTGQAVDLPTVATLISIPIAAHPVQSAPPLHQDITLHQYEDPDVSDPSSKRWLKPEVLHLIELHSSLEPKFTEAGPKGPLWEEIALGMAKKGYPNRTAKRCKEKWENINKYFKRAKESNKKRPENAKTCPYFHELDALYRKGSGISSNVNQLPYKPSIEPAQDDNVSHQPSMSNTIEEDFDRARALQMQPTATMPTECAAVSDASNASATDANNSSTNVGDVVMRNVNASNGISQTLGSMQLSMDAFRGLNVSNTSDHVTRSGLSAAELGLSIQQQSSTLDIYQHKQADFVKLMNVGGEHIESAGKPSLAPLPNSSSFMANMLQKLSSNNTSANNNPQD